jgi:hypothetical protein
MVRQKVIIVLLLMIGMTVWALPDDKVLKPFAKGLSKKIRVNFMETPLERVLEYIKKEAAVPFVIDRIRLGSKLRKQITLEVESMSLKAILDWICVLGGIDYDVRKNMLFVSTREEILEQYLEMKIYDVRALTIQPQDMPGPNIELVTGEADISISSMGSDSDILGGDAESLRELIMTSIRGGNWDVQNTGIDVGAGILVVTNTPLVHKRIIDLLNNFQKNYGKMIAFDVRFLLINSKALDDFLYKGREGSLILKPEEVDKLIAMAGSGEEGVRTLGASRTVCYNNQRIHVTGITQNSYMRDVTPVIATMSAGVDPEIDTWTDGIVFDVRPTASFDDRWISLSVRGTLARGGEKVPTRDVPVGNAVSTAIVDPAPAPDPDEEDNPEDRLVRAQSVRASAVVKIDLPAVDIVRFRNDLRVPHNGGVILSSGNDTLKHIESRDREVVMLIKASVLR